MIRIIFSLILLCAFSQAFADAPASTGRASSTDPKKKFGPLPWTEISVGTATLTQTLDETHIEHPGAFHASIQSRVANFHFGVGALGAIHNEQQSAGTYSQVNIGESLYMETLNAGLILGNFIILDGGFGLAQFRRSVSYPYGTPSSTTNVTANGTGWNLGGTIVPFRSATTSFGLTYYYFDATATSYSTDSAVGNTATSTPSPGKVHSSGSFTGLSILLNY